MIVKLQMVGVNRCIIHTQDRSFKYEGGMNDDMIQYMHERQQAYFEVSMGPAGLEIGNELPDQGWK